MRRAIGFGVLLLVAAGADAAVCSNSGTRPGGCPPGWDLCSSYCQHLAAARCGWPAGFGTTCYNQCQAAALQVPQECADAWNAALTCGTCATIQCGGQQCIDEPGGSVCIDQASTVTGCDAESAAFRSCAGSCLQSPVSFGAGGGSLDGGTRSVEATTSRCACPATLEPGAAAGAPCTTSGDCAQVCCACATGHGRYVIRTCENGRCVGAPDICAPDPFLASFCDG
jgi:hypothetical protein